MDNSTRPVAQSSQTQGMSSKRLELKIASDPATLHDVRLQIETFVAGCGGEKQCCDDVGLCLNEALANVMRHAYRGATDQPIVIEVEDIGDQVRILIRDWGRSFDPAVLKDRQHDPLQPGGLGMICMNQLMDRVQYLPQEKGMLLTMVKRKCCEK